MNYPNITLKFRHNTPSIELVNQEGLVSALSVSPSGLDTLLMDMADLVGFKYDDVEDILEVTRSGNELLLEFPEIDFAAENLDMTSVVEFTKQQISNHQVPAEATPAVAAQLNEYWQADVLASFLEEVYNTLIARTVFMASELAIPTIVLDDERFEPRLVEKMGKELSVLDNVEFIVTNLAQYDEQA